MNKMIKKVIMCLLFFLCVDTSAHIDAFTEFRYCGEPLRDKNGKIKRSTKVINRFKELHPCPANGSTKGACEGWAIDHVIPLACGGCDAVSNMQWLPNELKSKEKTGKDRFERVIYQKDIKCE